jgi:hypothetical protein
LRYQYKKSVAVEPSGRERKEETKKAGKEERKADYVRRKADSAVLSKGVQMKKGVSIIICCLWCDREEEKIEEERKDPKRNGNEEMINKKLRNGTEQYQKSVAVEWEGRKKSIKADSAVLCCAELRCLLPCDRKEEKVE